ILNMSPRLHAMTDSNPQLQEMMQNSIVLCQLVFPEMMQVLDCRIRPKIFSFKYAFNCYDLNLVYVKFFWDTSCYFVLVYKQADSFQRQGRQLRRKMWFQNIQLKLTVGGSIILFIVIVWLENPQLSDL
ncbi:hypothetical protein SOVF_213110 isoform B, partial [Spinacia oleracea]